MLIFPQERGVFLREVNNNLYEPSSYYWSKIFTEVPTSIIFPLISTAITYFAIGFNISDPYRFFIHILALVLTYNAFAGIGFILGTSVSNKMVISVLTPMLVVPMMLFAGFFVSQDSIPKWLLPFRETSIFKYAYQALFLNEFEGLELGCMSAKDPKEFCDPIGEYNSPQSLWLSILLLLIIGVVTNGVAFFILRAKAR